MGAWGAVCVFDEARYLSEIVPALRRGETDPLIAEHIHRQALVRKRTFGGPGLADQLERCSADLQTGPVRTWDTPDRDASTDGTVWDHDSLCQLFESMVITTCVPAYIFLGRRHDPIGLIIGTVGIDPTTEEIVARFRRCFWTHNSGGYREGIRGWIDPTTTQLLQLGLGKLRAEPWQASLSADRADAQAIAAAEVDMEQTNLWLDAIRRCVGVAVEQGLGILWGVDLRFLYARDDDPVYSGRVPPEL